MEKRVVFLKFPPGSFPCGWYVSGPLLQEITEEVALIVHDAVSGAPEAIHIYGSDGVPGRTALIPQRDRESVSRAIRSVFCGDIVWC
jgi:hypothetical protein